MIRVLKIQQTPILNFRDLQKRFWPAEIFRQMELFAELLPFTAAPSELSWRTEKVEENTRRSILPRISGWGFFAGAGGRRR